ncbi:MAG TPA: zinc ribbon domain-containing protein, partial [Herpetosiphonaceae bacterium]|nr:zinc ribbon domain-containing protein [Herpetosiphonaceae bacterium]
MALVCPNGHANDEGNRFCDQCGLPLSAAPAAAPAAATPAVVDSAAGTGSGEGGLACPTCGHENLPGTAFCDNCGSPLPPPQPAATPAATPPSPAAASATMAENAVRCPNCGSENDADNSFCEQCGASLAVADAGAATPDAVGTTMSSPVADESGVSPGAGDG